MHDSSSQEKPISPIVQVFRRLQRRHAPRIQVSGVEKAPRQEVAGSGARLGQRGKIGLI
jgi:hypothetical protein